MSPAVTVLLICLGVSALIVGMFAISACRVSSMITRREESDADRAAFEREFPGYDRERGWIATDVPGDER